MTIDHGPASVGAMVKTNVCSTVRSMECVVCSVPRGSGQMGCVWSVEFGVQSVECILKCGGWSVECIFMCRSVECGVLQFDILI